MNCPACVFPLTRHDPIKGSELKIYTCPLCSGIWISGINPAVNQQSKLPEDLFLYNFLSSSPSCVEEGNRECPECNATLELTKLGTIPVDICKSCGGIWFDKNELYIIDNDDIDQRKIIEKTINILAKHANPNQSGGKKIKINPLLHGRTASELYGIDDF